MPISLPLDSNRNPIQILPATIALATTYNTTISASTEVTLNSATTLITVTALTQAILMKWGTADVTTSNFDQIIPANTSMAFVVPIQSGTTLYTAVNFIEQAASAVLAVNEF